MHCLARYKIRCETDPTYQENLAKKRRERDSKNRVSLTEEEVVLALTPETRGAPRKYGIKKPASQSKKPVEINIRKEVK